jgi:hypothetical protein
MRYIFKYNNYRFKEFSFKNVDHRVREATPAECAVDNEVNQIKYILYLMFFYFRHNFSVVYLQL